MRELLTQDKNDGDDLDGVVQHLLKSRVKNDGAKMVTACFGVALAAELTFLSTFILPPEKWVLLQQTPLHKFFVGIPSPTCAGGCKGLNLGETPQVLTATKNQSTNPAIKPFDPMAFLKLWGDKMQLMQQQSQHIVVELRANK